jgi:uncharacterized protein
MTKLTTTFTVSRSFTTSVQRTPRVMEVAEAFGLGLSDKEFVVFDGLEMDVRPADVVYITGQSGSGKSLLLRDLAQQMRNAGLVVADLNEIVLEEKPVVELLGKTTSDALELLSRAGISDAWIYIRKPSELSDGQRYRLKLAMVLASDADVWIADEFGAVLDRMTAKVVAFNMAKVSRREGKIFMVATTHSDMIDELAPDVYVEKMFREKVRVVSDRDEDEVIPGAAQVAA